MVIQYWHSYTRIMNVLPLRSFCVYLYPYLLWIWSIFKFNYSLLFPFAFSIIFFWSGNLVCAWHTKKYEANALQRSIRGWLLGWSICSSPSTKELHAFNRSTSLPLQRDVCEVRVPGRVRGLELSRWCQSKHRPSVQVDLSSWPPGVEACWALGVRLMVLTTTV